MPDLKDIIAEKGFVTDRISTQVRIIAIGLLATTWSLLVGQVNALKDVLQCSQVHFILISIIAIMALVLDFLQYKFAYLNIDKKIKSMNDKKISEADYEEDIFYKSSKLLFIIKQYVLLAGVIYFIVCMIKIITR